MRRQIVVGAVLCVLAVQGCDRSSSSPSSGNTPSTSTTTRTDASTAATSPTPTATSDAAAPTAAARDASTAAPSSGTPTPATTGDGAAVAYAGTAEGAHADPPIREFAPNVQITAWSGRGTSELRIPAGNGAVTGSLVLGELHLDVVGYRNGDRVRATLEQPTPEGATLGSDAGVGVELFRGTLDATVSGNEVRGSWEASAQAGLLRRRGTLTAQRR